MIEFPITGWHAHIYYDESSKPLARMMRQEIGLHWPLALLGRMHDVPVGPHPAPMFQVAFMDRHFATLVPFLAMRRGSMVVLVHPETGRPKADHSRFAMWMGEVLPLNLDVLPESA